MMIHTPEVYIGYNHLVAKSELSDKFEVTVFTTNQDLVDNIKKASEELESDPDVSSAKKKQGFNISPARAEDFNRMPDLPSGSYRFNVRSGFPVKILNNMGQEIEIKKNLPWGIKGKLNFKLATYFIKTTKTGGVAGYIDSIELTSEKSSPSEDLVHLDLSGLD